MIDFREREGKKVAPSVQKDDDLTMTRFYALHSKMEKPDEKEGDEDLGKFFLFCCDMSSF